MRAGVRIGRRGRRCVRTADGAEPYSTVNDRGERHIILGGFYYEYHRTRFNYGMLGNRCRFGSYRRYRTWYRTGYRSRTRCGSSGKKPGRKGRYHVYHVTWSGRCRDDRSLWSAYRNALTFRTAARVNRAGISISKNMKNNGKEANPWKR